METEKGTEKKKTRCHICLKTIVGSSYKFNAHLYQHKAVEPRFKCGLCSREFFRSDEYNRHVKSHSENPVKKYYFCDDCGRGFVNKRNLMYHMKKIHDDNKIQNTVTTDFKCIACGVTYCEERSLKYHIRKNHFNLHEPKSLYIKKKLNETWLEHVKETNVCVQMTKLNNNVISIKKYGSINVKDNEKIQYNDKVKFKDYISSVFATQDNSHYSKAKCDYCHKEMLKKSLLAHIRERHLKIKRFKCDTCDRSFSRRYQLVDHDCNKPRRQKHD